MTTKKTKQLGLSGYIKTETVPVAELVKPKSNDKDDLKPITVKLSKANKNRLEILAIHEDMTLQSLGVEGFNLVLKARGLPPLEG